MSDTLKWELSKCDKPTSSVELNRAAVQAIVDEIAALEAALRGILHITDRKHVAWDAAHAALGDWRDLEGAGVNGVVNAERIWVNRITEGEYVGCYSSFVYDSLEAAQQGAKDAKPHREPVEFREVPSQGTETPFGEALRNLRWLRDNYADELGEQGTSSLDIALELLVEGNVS